jgi:hypothetical protein
LHEWNREGLQHGRRLAFDGPRLQEVTDSGGMRPATDAADRTSDRRRAARLNVTQRKELVMRLPKQVPAALRNTPGRPAGLTAGSAVSPQSDILGPWCCRCKNGTQQAYIEPYPKAYALCQDLCSRNGGNAAVWECK